SHSIALAVHEHAIGLGDQHRLDRTEDDHGFLFSQLACEVPVIMIQDSSTYWKKSRVELRAAGFDPDRMANASAVVTIASAYTNAHRCNNRVRQITDLLVELLAVRGGQGLIVGAPAVSDALTQGTPTAGYSLVSRDVAADCFEIGHHAHHGDAMI